MKKSIITFAAAAMAVSASQGITVLDESLAEISRVSGNLIVISDLDLATYINADTDLDTSVIVPEIIFVGDGDTTDVTLTIPGGAILRAEPRGTLYDNDGDVLTLRDQAPGSIVVTRGSKLYCNGTPGSPVIFTTAAIDAELANTDAHDGIGDGENDSVTWDDAANDNGAGGVYKWLDSDPIGNPLPLYTSTNPNAELGGGIIMLGFAPTNNGSVVDDFGISVNGYKLIGMTQGGFTGSYGEGFIEGLEVSQIGDQNLSTYGGLNVYDNSGAITFTSIRHGGSRLSNANEINGLTLGGVGKGTLISNVEVYCNQDDGYEFFGGTVDASYLVSVHNADDSIDIDEGFTGSIQFVVAMHYPDSYTGNNGIEADGSGNEVGGTQREALNFLGLTSGNQDDIAGWPVANSVLANFTAIGQGAKGQSSSDGDNERNAGFRLRDSWTGLLTQSIFYGFSTGLTYSDSDGLYDFIDLSHLIVDNIYNNPVDSGGGTQFVLLGSAGAEVSYSPVQNVSASGTFAGSWLAELSDSDITYGSDPFAPGFGPVPAARSRTAGADDAGLVLGTSFAIVPNVNSIANNALNSAEQIAQPAVLQKVGFIGAFEPGVAKWTDGWTASDALLF